ncbi:MAG: homoserine dehydrogenase, partial [Acetobacterales bacterium]
MNAPFRVAVAGLGTVGAGTVARLREHEALIAARAGRPVAVVAVSARDRKKNRPVSLDGLQWFDDPVAMAREADADAVVELVGGADGAAREVCEQALDAGRHVVTANKALLAHHGPSLAMRAEAAGVALAYEAAVAGGIPIIKALREGLSANRIESLHGILNGTCNYILTSMRETGRDFDQVLAEAQSLGYAEADPTFDIDGLDAAHKLVILASVAFGTPVSLDSVFVDGIRHVSSVDIQFAQELGYRIKLLGIARRAGERLEVRVHACMIPLSAQIVNVEDVYNAVQVEGD